MTTMTEQATQVYAVFIRATPEQVWDAITKPEFTTKYFHGTRIDSTFEPGTPYLSVAGSDTVVDGEILESDPPKVLKHTWRALYDPEMGAEPHSRVTWEIEPQEGGVTKLTVTHDQLEASPKTAEGVAGGWEYILSGLKTLLETGKPLQG
ncbi:MAG TPA: SRPBCC family protein [Gaiellaceae bacterium]|jgi:uncharacterized protein YndB with AHSA1/START domain